MPDAPAPAEWRRAAARRLLVPLVLAVAGMVMVLAGDRDGVWIAGWTLIGLAGVLTVGLAFLEVGYSEDRARAGGRGTRGG